MVGKFFGTASGTASSQHGVASLAGEAHRFVTDHSLLLVALPLLVVARVVYVFVLRARFFSRTRNYPGPPHGHWLMGQVEAIFNEAPGMALRDWHKKYGRVVRFAGVLPGQESLSFCTYPALKEILVDRAYEFPKPSYVRNVLGIAAGYGLLTLEGPEHQALRRFMNQAFAFKYLNEQYEQYYIPINALVENLDKRIRDGEKTQSEGVALEMTKPIDSCLMDIICLTAFGYECDSMHNEEQPLANAYHKLVNLQNGGNLLVLFLILMMPFGPELTRYACKRPRAGRFLRRLANLLGSKSETDTAVSLSATFAENLAIVNNISAKLLQDKMDEARHLKKAAGGQFAMDVSGGKVDILSLLVRANLDDGSPYKMNSDMLQYQMLTFLGAGHETTASAAAWALWEMATHPDLQEKLRKECQELITRNHNPGHAEIKDLLYLHAVIQETLRVRPPTPMTSRCASKDSYVEGVFVPKGSMIMIPIRTVNFDETIWGPDALEFKPERWLEPPPQYNATFSMLTFIAGPHHCIGRNMSVNELKALLCTLFANFSFEPAQDEPLEKSAITMKPEGGLRLRIRRLNPSESIRG